MRSLNFCVQNTINATCAPIKFDSLLIWRLIFSVLFRENRIWSSRAGTPCTTGILARDELLPAHLSHSWFAKALSQGLLGRA